VLAITRLFGKKGRARVGAEACPGSLWREAADARILHFACHGLLDPYDPLASAVVLGPEPGRPDGTIRAYEVMQRLRLRADLVTLSACETALGEESRHEGMIGLARAFQYAGARSVLVSHWKVLDLSTTRLMAGFYRQIRAGRPRDEALRLAQISLLGTKEYAHPFHWAGFALQGYPR
jgi:CHAT domain-containing protein